MSLANLPPVLFGFSPRTCAPRPVKKSIWRMDKEYQAESNKNITTNKLAVSLALPCKWHCYSLVKVLSACLQFCTAGMNPIACTRLDSRTDLHLCQTIHSVYCMVRSTRLLPIRNEKLEMRNCGMRFAHEYIKWEDRSEKWEVADIFIIIYKCLIIKRTWKTACPSTKGCQIGKS